MSINEIIKNTALKYLGKKEKENNSGFADASFETKMKSVGWLKGQSWCSYFVELVWLEAMPSDATLIKKYCSGSVVTTFKNFKASAEFKVQQLPVVGAIVAWEKGKSGLGHIGIVVQVNADGSFKHISGNTNSDGSREGVEVAFKVSRTGKPFSSSGMNLLGFISPIKIK